MARTATARDGRAALKQVTALAARDLSRVWIGLDLTADVARIREALLEVVPDIGETYGDVSATLAVDMYDELRDEALARGRFAAEPAGTPGRARLEASIRWGLGPLLGANPDPVSALTLIEGSLQRYVADPHRDTITQSIAHDPAKPGWARETSAGSCDFCQMLAGRGAVYREDTSGFDSHDHCHCIAVPTWD